MFFPQNYQTQIISGLFKESSLNSTNDEEDIKYNFQDKCQKMVPDVTKFKTELCKEFQINYYCKYGNKCKFAHGKEELLQKSSNIKFKSKYCKQFFEKNYCNYGSRCQFIHEQRNVNQIQQNTFFQKKIINMEIDDILDDCEVNRLPIFLKINNLEKKKKITSFID